MNRIMTVYDVFPAADGSLVLGGTDADLGTASLEQIKAAVAGGVRVTDAGGRELGVCRVDDVAVSTALSGRRNVHFKLAGSIRKADGLLHGAVFTTEERPRDPPPG